MKKITLLLIIEIIVIVAVLYYYSSHNTFALKEINRVNRENGEKETVILRLNKRTGEVWELGTNIPVNLKQEFKKQQ
ncbi:MAG: hypothetical protein ACR2NW_03355 [Thermodesulfobacteriota bacterium]